MKRAIALTLCLAALAFFAASCQTTQKCPAYAHHYEVAK